MSLIQKIGFAASKPFNRAADVIWVRPLHCAPGTSKRYALGALIKETDKDSKIAQAETYIKKWIVNLANRESCIVTCEIIYCQPGYGLFAADCSAHVDGQDVNCLDIKLKDEQVYALTIENSVYIETPMARGNSIDFSRKYVSAYEFNLYDRRQALKGEFVSSIKF